MVNEVPVLREAVIRRTALAASNWTKMEPASNAVHSMSLSLVAKKAVTLSKWSMPADFDFAVVQL
jgi:hypothetical protein